jgi:DNA-binding LacI/PurR family transcriptional regulator
MYKIMTREQLKSKIPYGYAKKIAAKAGVSRMTVSSFMNGKNNNVEVEMAALEILAELNQAKNNLIAKIG